MTLFTNSLTAEKNGISRVTEFGLEHMAKVVNKALLEQALDFAIQNKDTEQLNQIGRLFYNPQENIDQNIELSIKAFQHSLKFGDKNIAVCYLTDIYAIYPVDVDDKTVIDTLHKAIDVGYAEAMFILGLKYSKGDIVEKDIDKGTYWFEKAHIYNSLNIKKFVKEILGWDDYEEFKTKIEYIFDHDELKLA